MCNYGPGEKKAESEKALRVYGCELVAFSLRARTDSSLSTNLQLDVRHGVDPAVL